MTKSEYSLEQLQEFLREAPVAGLLNPAVAKSRGAALEQVVRELTPAECADVRQIDVDEVCDRLYKIEESSVRPEVIELYNKRLKATFTDYIAWVNDSKSFRSVGGDRAKANKRGPRPDAERAAETRALEETSLTTSEWAPGLLSIPLRDELSVFVHNLPFDLSADEARKIARVIEALASDKEAKP